MTLKFPFLIGQAYPVKRTGTIISNRTVAVSGRKSNSPIWAQPLYQFEVGFEYLSPTDWQTLEGFWKRVMMTPGQNFLFPFLEDSLAAAQSMGAGDGATVAFQLARSYGDFNEVVTAPRFNLLNTALSTGSGWAITNGSYSSTTSPDPWGGTTAVKLNENATNAEHYTSTALSSTLVDNEWYRFSVFAAPSQRSWIALSFTDKAGGANRVYFNVTTGAIGSTSGNVRDMRIVPAGGGFYRCAASFKSSSGATAPAATVVITTGDAAAGYVGSTGNGIFLAGAQFEQGAQITADASMCSPYPLGPVITVSGSATAATITAVGKATFGSAPANLAPVAWSGSYDWLCQFDEDSIGLENFAYRFWNLQKVTFTSVRVP